MNGYSYVGNNPLKYVDEEGEFAFLVPIIAYAPVWVPATITAIGAVGGAIAAWHYGGALGYYKEGDYARGDAALDTSILASTTTAEIAGGMVAIGDAMGAGGTKGSPGAKTRQDAQGDQNAEQQKITIDPKSEKHIFRNDAGHISDTAMNRQLLTDMANNPQNFLGPDKRGNQWYGKTLNDGKQVWAEVRDGKIWNGGINNAPKTFNPETGLSSPVKTRQKVQKGGGTQ